ncbi:hypothetical protein PLICRDRAFT_111857 [Plicaturopsis crispa FD-325 SS-3]|nr:hypothetical protein PLICRDRAFT_111857 [Plicaturopsis crispa FD-325 SS-3]
MLLTRLIAATLVISPSVVVGFSFSITSTPQQCQNLSLSISGSGGQAPYSVVVIPFGPSPLPNNIEARRITNTNFTGSSTDVSFQLKYPTNSQFVAVVSDATGFGTGGTSVAATVLSSNDSSCFDASTNVSPDFVFSIEPPNQLVQCQSTRIWWDPSKVQGTPSFLGVIPGGDSFSIPQGSITQVPSQGTGFSWTPAVRGGTTLLIVGGDNRGEGSAGSVLFSVSSGTSNDNSCLNSNSPSSTPGSPAGGSYPTSSSGAGTGGGNSNSGGNNNNSSSSKTNVGAIVGGVVGGIAGLVICVLLALFFVRRKRFHERSHKERPVDLLQGDEGDDEDASRQPELPQYYQPEPFMVPEPTITASSVHASDDHGGPPVSYNAPGHPRRISQSTLSSDMRSGTPDAFGVLSGQSSAQGSSSNRKSAGGPRTMRPVNIIQHDDAGPNEDETAETIELPPAYTNLKRAERTAEQPASEESHPVETSPLRPSEPPT